MAKTSPSFLAFLEGKSHLELWAKLALFPMFPKHVEEPKFAKNKAARRLMLKGLGFLSRPTHAVKDKGDYFLISLPILETKDLFYEVASYLAFCGVTSATKVKDDFANYPKVFLLADTVKGINDNSDLVGEPLGRFPEALPEQTLRVACSAYPITGEKVVQEFPFPVPDFVRSVTYTAGKVTADIVLTKNEFHKISTLPINLMRELDVWEFVRTLLQNRMGVAGKLCLRYFPLSFIKENIIGKQERELLGFLINNKAELLYLPERVNRVIEYEDYSCKQGEGDSFQIKSRTKFKNRLLFTDFVNEKLVYTSASGNPLTVDLTQYQVVNQGQKYRILENSAHFLGTLGRIEQWGKQLGIVFAAPNTTIYFELNNNRYTISGFSISNASPVSSIANILHRQSKGLISFADLLNNQQQIPLFLQMVNYIKEVTEKFKPSLLTLYSIPLSLQTLAYMKLICEAPDKEVLTKQRGELEPLPLVAPDLGRLPHQVKCSEILAPRPRLAALPVQAGGGKTPLCLFDILHNLDTIEGKIAVLCPSHLVSQYVSENNYFTNGKLNIIPFTTEAIRNHTLEGLIRIIEQAPRNTAVIIDMDCFKYYTEEFIYGSHPVTMYTAAQMLKRLNFEYVLIDESHYLANDNSLRTQSCQVFINDVTKYRRIASGTLTFDSPSDLPAQYGLLDPTILYSRETFNETFGELVSGQRVVRWKPTASKDIESRISNVVAVAAAQRKEWAALLPNSNESIHRVQLTPNQKRVYEIILNYTIEEIKKNPAVIRRIQEDEDADIDGLLNPYLSRLEQFISAPGEDELGKLELKGEDLVSTKVAKIEEILNEHVGKIPGKVLIFTNHVAVAEHIYNNLPDNFKQQTILYKAEQKHRYRRQFDEDPNKQIMVGVGQSLYTGLNLQEASRVIRVETVWSPGLLEQGESRVKRPQLKKEEKRKEIFSEWIVADHTIDITKLSRLISKIITVERFENIHLESFRKIPEVDVIKMTLDNIIELNDWDTSLREYADVYSQLRRAQQEEYNTYKEYFLSTYKGDIFTPVERRPARDVYLNPNPVFIKGMSLPYQDELKLKLVDGAAHSLGNARVLTDLGLGRILKDNKDTVRVELQSGLKKSFHKQATFLVQGNPKIKERLARYTGLKYKQFPAKKEPLKMRKGKVLYKRITSNHYEGKAAYGKRNHLVLVDLQKKGYKLSNNLYELRITNKRAYKEALSNIEKHGLTPANGTKQDFDLVEEMFRKRPTIERSRSLGAKNPLTMEFKSTEKTYHLYFDIQGKEIFLVTDHPKVKQLGWKYRRRRFVKF